MYGHKHLYMPWWSRNQPLGHQEPLCPDSALLEHSVNTITRVRTPAPHDVPHHLSSPHSNPVAVRSINRFSQPQRRNKDSMILVSLHPRVFREILLYTRVVFVVLPPAIHRCRGVDRQPLTIRPCYCRLTATHLPLWHEA
jgi:hypothetical protein